MTATQNRPDPKRQDATANSSAGRPFGRGRTPRSRIGGVWVALIAATVVLLFLLIFVLQNGQRVELSFLGAHGTLPMGVALLLAAVFGVLLVALPGTARIIQLRASRSRGSQVDSTQDRPHTGQHTREPSTPNRTAGRRADQP